MSNPSLTESNFDWPFYVVFVYRKSIHIDGAGKKIYQIRPGTPPKIYWWYKDKKKIRKMFSVKLLVRGERFCVGGGWGEDGLKVLISKSTA